MSDPMRSEACRLVGRSVQAQDFRSSFGHKVLHPVLAYEPLKPWSTGTGIMAWSS